MTENHYTVSEVARLAHVSVRTLHHYDEIGLLAPAQRTAAGYRLYSEADLRRLHEILIFRELGLSLDAVQRMVAASAEERAAELRAHRGELLARKRRTEAVIRAVEAKLEALERGTTMERNGMFEGFADFDHAKYAEEAEQRWGDTEAFRESARRTRGYTPADWATIKQESNQIMEDWLVLHADGADPTSARAMSVAERHRQHIDRWFYECGPAFHVGLADMWLADPRFRETFESRREGLTEYAAASVRANAGRGTRSPERADPV